MPSPFRILEILACSLVSFLPYLLLIIYPLRRQLRFGSTATATLTTFAAIVQLVCDLAVGLEFLAPDIAMITAFAIHAFLCLILIRASFGKKLFTLLSTLCAAVVISSTADYLAQSLFPSQSSGLYRWPFLLLTIGQQAVILIPYVLLILKQYSEAMEDRSRRFPWGGMTLIFAAVLAVWIFLSSPGYADLQLASLVVLPLFVFACLAVRYIIRTISKLDPIPVEAEEVPVKKPRKEKKEKKAKKSRKAEKREAVPAAVQEEQPAPQAEAAPAAVEIPAAAPQPKVSAPVPQADSFCHADPLQNLQYNSLITRITESDQFHRELCRHVEAMAYRLDRQQYDKLQLHVRSLQEQLTSELQASYCENKEISSMITYYTRMAGYCGTRVNASLQLAENPPVRTEDLTVLLGNLLDNALDACKCQSGGNRWINVSLNTSGNALYITVKNSCDTQLRKTGSGTGLEICRQITARYNGTLELNDADGIFHAAAILRP